MTTFLVIDNPQWRPQWSNFNFLPQCLDNFTPINIENARPLMFRQIDACFPTEPGAGHNKMKYYDSAFSNKNYSNQCGGTIMIIEGPGKRNRSENHTPCFQHVSCFNSLFANICPQFSLSKTA